jgi:Phage P22-like portal protein
MATKKKEPDAEKKEGQQIDVLNYEGKVDKNYKPEGFKSQEAFLADMRKQYQHDIDYDRINREQALDDKKFAAGEQWDPIVLEQRAGLPCLVLNNIPQFTAQLVGDWRESRKAIKVVPANDEDTDVASVRSDLIRAIEQESRASRVYDSAFESLVQCGDGAFRVCVEYARDDVFDQDIRIRPIEDVLSTVWDRYSVDPTGRDAKRVFVDDRIPKEEFNRKYPECSPDELLSDNATRILSTEGWVDEDSYRVTEYWRLIERQRIMAIFQNGKVFELNEDNMEKLILENGPPVKTRLAWVTFAQMHLVTGFAILQGPYEYRLNRLPIIRMSGRVVNVGGRRVRYGLVRFLKDAARLKNFWRSVAAEQLGYAPKAKWIAPESAVEGREDQFRQAHLSRDPLLIYNDGAEAPPELIPPPPVEASLLNEAAQNAQDMKDITGIHDASLGIRSNETSGRAIQARQREGDIANLTFYDNANEAVMEAGDVTNQLIPQIYDGTRVLRLLGEDEKLKFQRVNDPMDPNSVDLSVGQYDVQLATGTSYTTRRVEAAQSMMDAIQVWPQLMTVAGDIVARAQDWPGADKIAERLEQTMNQPQIDPQQVQQMQEQLQKLQMENAILKLANKDKQNDHEVDIYNAETQRIRALSDHDVDANQMEMDAIAQLLNAHKTADELDIKREQVQNKSTAEGTKTASPSDNGRS